jgi:hypothetical protein
MVQDRPQRFVSLRCKETILNRFWLPQPHGHTPQIHIETQREGNLFSERLRFIFTFLCLHWPSARQPSLYRDIHIWRIHNLRTVAGWTRKSRSTCISKTFLQKHNLRFLSIRWDASMSFEIVLHVPQACHNINWWFFACSSLLRDTSPKKC